MLANWAEAAALGRNRPPPAARALARIRSEGWRYATAVLVVGTGSVGAEILARDFNATRVSNVYLATVLVVAAWHGLYPALFAALLAFGTFNFFLVAPRYTFQFVS